VIRSHNGLDLFSIVYCTGDHFISCLNRPRSSHSKD
jgi:hypothetical protein